MNPADDLLDQVASDLADGHAIDWEERLRQARTPEERIQLECLRAVGGIAQIHDSTIPSVESSSFTHGLLDSTVEPDAGEVWGRFRLVKKVGAGSFGSVYRARDPELERDIAIKILHRHVTDDQLKERLLREGRALARVSHANVVRVIGVESHDGRVGLCTEFVKGETLESVVKTLGTMNAREAIGIGEDMCRALAAVHQAGFVHCDVKARNIMREEGGRNLLMDFGTGRELQGGDVRGMAGTPLYMAPEVLAGEPATTCSDIYSAGVLLYYLVTGKYPVEGRSLADLQAAHMQQRRMPLTERRPDLPLPFVQVVERALHPNPQQRWPSAAAMLQALGALEGAVESRRSLLWWAGRIAAGTVGLLMALGAVNSRYFNITLGRTAFARESPLDWLAWGFTASVAPVVLLAGVVLIIALLDLCRRTLITVSSAACELEAALLARARAWRLNDPSTLGTIALALSGAALVLVWGISIPFLSALMDIPNISSAPLESVGFLSPVMRPAHDAYRAWFTGLAIWCVIVWAPVVWLARSRREPVHVSVVAGGIAVMTLTLLLLNFPYRVLAWDKRNFEAVRWQGERCYIIGQSATDLLLFCPSLAVPRNRPLPKSTPDLERTGEEDIFTHVPVSAELRSRFIRN